MTKEQTMAMLAYVAGVAISNGLKDYKQLADAAGVHRQQLSRWMNGRSGLTLSSFLKLCAAAGVDLELKGGNFDFKLSSH